MAAVRAFPRAQGLPVTGTIDAVLWEAVSDPLAPGGPSSSSDGRPDVVPVQDYRDSLMVGLGAESRLDEARTWRGGIQYERLPLTDGAPNPSLPDGDPIWLGLGASWRWRDAIWLDVGWAHVAFADGDIDLTQVFDAGTPLATTARTRGEASTRVDTLSLSLRVRF